MWDTLISLKSTYLLTIIFDLDMQMVNEVLMKMLYLSPNRGLLYITDIFSYSGKPSHNLEHLSCFFPGLLALGVNTLPDEVFANAHALFTATQAKRLSGYNMKDLHMWAAIGLGETCWRMYADNPTGLSPEIIRMPAPMTHPDPKSPIPDSGLWLDALDLWTSSKTGATPPGLDDKTLQNATDPTEKDYRIIRGDYLLRPEVCHHLLVIVWKPQRLTTVATCRRLSPSISFGKPQAIRVGVSVIGQYFNQ